MIDATPDLFAGARDGVESPAPVVDRAAGGSRGADRGVVLGAADVLTGPYWPRYEVQRITTLTTDRERAQAFLAIPPAFQLMAARMLHRWYVRESPLCD